MSDKPISSNNYNYIAPFYDAISKIVFGNKILRAQQVLMQFISEGDVVAIAGGGTGAILEMLPQYAQPLQVYYIEQSAAMLHQAKKKNKGNNYINFVHCPVETFDEDVKFDIVVTPFLFDNFAAAQAAHIFQHIHKLTKPNARWLFTDFYLKDKAPLKHRLLLKTMYFFFRIIAGVKAKRLVPMEPLFEGNGYKVQQQYSFLNGFIQSSVYTRLMNPMANRDVQYD